MKGQAPRLISHGSASSRTSSVDGADQRPEHRAHAAQHHHDDEIPRARPMHHRRADEIGVVGEQRAGKPHRVPGITKQVSR